MPGDYTRVTFDPFEDHLGVLMQQGRVLLDADFNELIEILDRRFRAETIDIIGRCVVPKETPDGFRIQFSGSTITIGRGRLYAHGLLAENHGKAPLEFDRVLAEERGALPIPYAEQPYLPNVTSVSPLPASGGPHLVYADVWQRELTCLEEPDLLEKAVGVDTATRLQTVWQVKVLPDVGNVTCSTPDGEIPGWIDIIEPSAGRLTTSTIGVPADTDPCVVNPAGGFLGTENRLYRVEIHDKGPLGQATFKWSRDNASIASAVTAINAGLDVLTVSRTGRDAVLRFQPEDWVEVTDDFREFAGLPGEMRKVLQVDDVSQTLTLTAPLTAGVFDTVNPGARHTRVRRWDQKGQVFDAANNVVADVDASGGVIPVPASGALVLEDGIQVEFTVAQAGGQFHAADYWVFAARTVDAALDDPLVQAPPKGIHHHFCRLALVTFPGSVVDCRTLWPPDFGEKGCDCTHCVSAESHNSGTFTIQMAIDLVKASGGKVCLGPGIFNLGTTPVQINGGGSIQVQGHGWKTMLIYGGAGPAIGVVGSTGIDIDQLAVLALSGELPNMALGVRNSALVRVQRCLLAQFGRSGPLEGAIAINGFLIETSFRENILLGSAGLFAVAQNVDQPVTTAPNFSLAALTWNLRVERNLIAGRVKGISLEGFCMHLGETRLAGNGVYGGRSGGILARGLVMSEVLSASRLDVAGNHLGLLGDGIVVSTDHARVSENDIGAVLAERGQPASSGSAIVVAPSVQGTIDRLQVIGNRIAGIGGDGISIRGAITSGMIKQNIIDGIRGNGIVMDESAEAEELTIENNQVLRAGRINDPQTMLAGIRAARVRQLDISANTIDQFGLTAIQNPVRFGIEVVACNSVRVSGNDLINIGPFGQFLKLGAGILVQGPFDRVDVVDNSVRRSRIPPTAPDPSTWHAVRIAQPLPGPGGPFTPAPAGGSLLFPFVVSAASGFLAVGVNAVVALPAGKEMVAVRGNLLETYGIGATVSVGVASSGVFSDNRCLLEQSPGNQTPVALITSGAAIVNANFLRRAPASDATPALLLTTGQGPFTVLGNVFNGIVRVNNAALGAPWLPLNAIVFG